MFKPDYMPADAQPVTLFGKPGWFVSQESIDAQGMAQQWKRPAQARIDRLDKFLGSERSILVSDTV